MLPTQTKPVPLVKPFIVSHRDLAWTAARKKMLTTVNAFAKALAAWQTKTQAYDTFAKTLNLETWSNLRHALRVLDKFEQTYLLLIGEHATLTRSALSSLYTDNCVADFLGLPDFTGNVDKDHAQLRQCVRRVLDMLAYNPKQSWVTAAQLNWLKLQQIVVSDFAGSQANTLVASAWGLTHDQLSNDPCVEDANIVRSRAGLIIEQYESLKSTQVASSEEGFWIRAGSATEVFKSRASAFPEMHLDDSLSMAVACQVVTEDTLLHVSNEKPLALLAAVTRPLHLSMLCRVGWLAKPGSHEAIDKCLHVLPTTLLRPTWQILV